MVPPNFSLWDIAPSSPQKDFDPDNPEQSARCLEGEKKQKNEDWWRLEKGNLRKGIYHVIIYHPPDKSF